MATSVCRLRHRLAGRSALVADRSKRVLAGHDTEEFAIVVHDGEAIEVRARDA